MQEKCKKRRCTQSVALKGVLSGPHPAAAPLVAVKSRFSLNRRQGLCVNQPFCDEPESRVLGCTVSLFADRCQSSCVIYNKN